MNRILVLGSPGSGKSTIAVSLSKKLNLPVIHLDKHYWNPNWIPTPEDKWLNIVTDLSKQDKWIIDGNYSTTMDIRLKRAEMIILLDLPRWLCIYRIFKRRITYHGRTRNDMNEECPEKLDWAFFKWVWNYKKRSRMKTLNKLNELKDQKTIYIARTRKQVESLIERTFVSNS